MQVINLFDIEPFLRCRLNDEILKNYQFLEELDCDDNKNVTDTSHLKYLEKLSARYDCGINKIENENLKVLFIDGNKKIRKLGKLIKN